MSAFKSQASSSRAGAVASGAGFGGFGSGDGTGSMLSYLTNPPNLSAISDANVVVAFKNLSKKDSTTKAKALEDLRAYAQAHPFDAGGVEEAILEAWIGFYPRIAIDNSRRVRELAHGLQYELLQSTRRKMEKKTPKVVGAWLAGTFDRDRGVARAASSGIASFLDSDEKVVRFWKRCQDQILDYARDALSETTETLSDERTVSADDAQAKFFRVIGSALSLVINLFSKLSIDDMAAYKGKYDSLLSSDTWILAKSEDSSVRRLVYHLLITCIEKRDDLVQGPEFTIIQQIFTKKVVSEPQIGSSLQLVQALRKLTQLVPRIWDSIDSKKRGSINKIRSLLKKGSQNGPPEFWRELSLFVKAIPQDLLPSDIKSSSEFLRDYQVGISSRGEIKKGVTLAWNGYFEVARILADNLKDSSDQKQLFENSIHPVFKEYLHATPETSLWSLGEDRSQNLARAFAMCASFSSEEVVQSLEVLFQELSQTLKEHILTSLPEQSKDYQVSQNRVVVEGENWFQLLSELQKSTRRESAGVLERVLFPPTRELIACVMSVIDNRDGKPYSAASILANSLRLAPDMIKESQETLQSVVSFLQTTVPRLITSPSSSYLISSLYLLRSMQGEEQTFETIWQASIDSLLSSQAGVEKVDGVLRFVSDDAMMTLTHPKLQTFLTQTALQASQNEPMAWPIFSVSIKKSCLTEASERNIINGIYDDLLGDPSSVEGALKALNLIAVNQPLIINRDSKIHENCYKRLWELSELCEPPLSSRALDTMRTLAEIKPLDSEKPSFSLTIKTLQESLSIANKSSMSYRTLAQEAKKLPMNEKILPDLSQWDHELKSLINKYLDLSLSITDPLICGVSLIAKESSAWRPSKELENTEDVDGYSLSLRYALYTANLLDDGNHELLKSLSRGRQVELLYLLSLTVEFANDQIELAEDHRLWTSPSKLVFSEIHSLMIVQQKYLRHIMKSVGESKAEVDTSELHSNSQVMLVARELMMKAYESSSSIDPVGYYSARVLNKILSQQNMKDDVWRDTNEVLISDLAKSKSSIENPFKSLAVLTGLTNLAANGVVNNLCNQLVSELVSTTATAENTLKILAVLNACFTVYDHDLPVAQSRLVFALKEILSWAESTNSLWEGTQTGTEVLRALQRILPAVESIYGSWWTKSIEFGLETCNLFGKRPVPVPNPPAIHAALRLFVVLQSLDDSNDDREDALQSYNDQISEALLDALKLPAAQETAPLRVLNELLGRLASKITPPEDLDNLSELYPLVASDISSTQTAAFSLLTKALPAVQQQISVDVIVEKKDAQLPDELLSLLMEPPVISKYTDSDLHQFPLSIRSYLLTWHLIFDCFSTASYKVRADYIASLKGDNFVEPLLDFVFDVLINSDSNPLSLNKNNFRKESLRKFDITGSDDDDTSMHLLMVHLWFQTLKYTPSLGKTWWVDCKSKFARKTVQAWTEKFISSAVVEDSLAEVSLWADEQQPDDDGKTLEVKISKKSGEAFVGYDIDEMQIQLVIRFPSTYPLDGAKVEGLNRVAISEKKWRSWLMIIQGVITFSNGSLIDGLAVFRNNITGTLKGQTECAICYSIVSSDRKMPDKRCGTCKNLFHAGCLLKWFSTSAQSSCPLCRNQFTFAVDPVRRPRAAGPA